MDKNRFEKLISKISEVSLLFILFMSGLVFFSSASDPFWVVERFFLKFSTAILIILYVVKSMTKGSFSCVRTPYDSVFALIIAINLAGIFSAKGIYAYVDRLTENLCYIALFYLAAQYCASERTAFKKALSAVILSALVMAVYGVLQAGGIDPVNWNSNFSRRAASTLGNPNFLAGHMLIVIPLAYGLMLTSATPAKKFVFFIVSLFLTAALITSQTRGAYIGFAVSVIVLAALLSKYEAELFKKYRKLLVAFLVICAAAAGLYFAANPSAVKRITDIVTLKDEAAHIRVSLWKNTAYMIKENPLLGSGAGNFPIKYSFYQSRSLSPAFFKSSDYYKSGHSHNDFLQFAAEYGLPGAGAYFAFFFLLFYTGIRYLRRTGEERAAVAAILACFAGVLVHAMFNFPFQIIPTASVFYALAGMACARQLDAQPRSIKAGRAAPAAAVCAVILAGCMACLSARVLSADVYLRKAQEAEHFNRQYDALNYASDAADLNPWNDRINYYYAGRLRASGNFDRAFEKFKLVYKLNPGYWENLVSLFDAYVSKNNPKDGKPVADAMYAISPYSMRAVSAMGYVLYSSGKYTEAIQLYEKASASTGESASLLSQMSACYGAMGNVQKTIEYAQKAATMDPSFTDAYYNLAVAYYRMQNYGEAIKNLREILRYSPNDERANGLMKVIENAGKK
ncbi:MAG: O-antigen ligase family protein [Spirochaetia bacterium]|nr:O-antigen ligase family protein [Spirochaetia bacterium]